MYANNCDNVDCPEDIVEVDFLTELRPLRSYFPFCIQKLLPKNCRKFIRNNFSNTHDISYFDNIKLKRNIYLNNFNLNDSYIINTHDIDSDAGISPAKLIFQYENQQNIKSVWFINYKVLIKNIEFANDIIESGHEIGLHDIIHDSKTPYLSEQAIERRLEKSIAVIEKYKIISFRSSGLYRTKRMYKVLNKYFKIDSSIPTFDFNNRNACKSIMPFYIDGKLLEIPLTLPMDSDFIFSDFTNAEMVQIWKKICNFIVNKRGLIVNTTHTEPHFFGNKKYRHVYKKIIEYQKNLKIKFIKFKDVLKFDLLGIKENENITIKSS